MKRITQPKIIFVMDPNTSALGNDFAIMGLRSQGTTTHTQSKFSSRPSPPRAEGPVSKPSKYETIGKIILP